MATDPIDAATKFDDAVRSTATVGGLVEKVESIDARTDRIETKLDHVVSTIDRWGGVVVVVSALMSIATGMAVWLGGSLLVHALGIK